MKILINTYICKMKKRNYLTVLIAITLIICILFAAKLNFEFLLGFLAGLLIFIVFANTVGAIIVNRTADKLENYNAQQENLFFEEYQQISEDENG